MAARQSMGDVMNKKPYLIINDDSGEPGSLLGLLDGIQDRPAMEIVLSYVHTAIDELKQQIGDTQVIYLKRVMMTEKEYENILF